MKTRRTLNALVTFFAMFTTMALNAQTYPGGMQEHGNNSSGTTTAAENIDSVSVGSTIDYFVMPDANLNPSYDFSTDPTANLNSTFNWSSDGGQTVTTKTGMGSNYVEVDWDATTGTGSYTLEVTEQSGGACVDATPTQISVAVIGLPTAAFDNSVYGGYTSSVCSNDPTAETFNFPISLSTEVIDGDVEFTYSMTNTTTGTVVTAGTALNLDESNTTFTFNSFPAEYGDYEVTITAISDRISTKSGVAGDINTGVSDVFTYTISRTPETGVIYHVPNL